MTEHRLDPLLQPASIALLGASARAGSPGHILATMVLDSEYAGAAFAVNPGYAEILGRRCYPDLESLPSAVDHVVIALSNEHLEGALRGAIEHGARAATIYSSGVLEADSEPRLTRRLAAIAKAAEMHVCGINGMGFYNLRRQLYAGIFPRPAEIIQGGISYIAQSGSAFTALCHNGCRLGFNLCVSAGNELTTTIADYMDWSLEQPDTRAIGLFVETVRDPQAFVAALARARGENIPVVILKIGKSPQSAAMALTHTGAIAGSHAAFAATCRRYGVIEVQDFDEMAAILMLLQSGRAAPAGGFAAVFESGGLRELITDQANEIGLEFAPLQEATGAQLKAHLEPGLAAENPLDAWGSNHRFEERFQACLELVMQDPNVAGGAFISNIRDDYYLSEAIYRVVEAVSQTTAKPLALATCYTDLAHDAISRRAHAAGIPLIDGARETLLAFRQLFEYHRRKREPWPEPGPTGLDPGLIAKWRQKLSAGPAGTLTETESLTLLHDFALPVARHQPVSNETELIAAAKAIGYPLVLKTAQPGIDHKSESDGVRINIRNETELREAYADLAARLGPQALVSQMVDDGVEIGLGTVRDAQFGPLVMVAAGGVLVELLGDRALALCPLGPQQAEALLASLRIDRRLRGFRGKAPCNRKALIGAIVRLSEIAFELRDCIAEIDINPVIVNPQTALAVDALILHKH